MSEAPPAELWVSPGVEECEGLWLEDNADEPDAVRYVRADIYDALMERMRIVRSWNEAPCLDPLGSDIH
jgi:hypothetical protein